MSTKRQSLRANGPATVLAVATAVPPNVFDQSTYPDFFFDATNCNDKVEMKKKFQRICDRSGIKKRHFYLTHEILKENPKICSYMGVSLDARQDIGVLEVPKLAKEAAVKAMAEWGQPKSKITHLVFGTTSSIDMPGADFQLLKLLGLRPNVKRVMIYQQGCFAGGTVMRIAKDIAENNKGARVLVACSEVTALTFSAPSEKHMDGLVGSALFGDGAAALVIGSDPVEGIEHPIFELHMAIETVLPESEGAILGHLRESGLVFHLLKDVPGIISKNVAKVLGEVLEYSGCASYNDMFWVVHPGGPAILDQMAVRLGLDDDKLRATRYVLAEYGNMSSASVLFVLDEMRKRRSAKKLNNETKEWGIMLCFGPGLTVEALLLKNKMDRNECIQLIQSCRTLSKAKGIHALIRHLIKSDDIFMCNKLIEMYGKCGSSKHAHEIFDSISPKNSFSWVFMLSAYSRNGHVEEAKNLFDQMPERNVVSRNVMLSTYLENGRLQEARRLFEEMPERDMVLSTTMLAAYARNGHMEEARHLFEQMPQQNLVSTTAMLAAYAQNGHLKEAKRIFNEMPQRNLISWNAMLAAYALNGHLEEAKQLFQGMPEQDVICWNAMVSAFAQNGQMEESKHMFDAMSQRNLVSWNAMLSAYAQNGHLQEARDLFEGMPERNLVSSTAMLAAYAQNGNLEEAKRMFDEISPIAYIAMHVQHSSN